MQYKVSVIVPIYNVSKYLEKCLNSLMLQTLEALEVILVNDGSTDNSKDICLDFLKKNAGKKKFIYLEKENGGLSEARNYGISHATGEYICFLDSDDYIDEKTYEQMYNTAKESDALLVESELYYTYTNREKVVKLPQNYKSVKEYLITSRVAAWNKLINREWFLQQGILFPKGLLYEDVSFFFKLYSNIKDIDRIVTIHKPFFHYVQRENSILHVKGEKLKDIVKIFKDIIKYLEERNLFEEYKEIIEYKATMTLLCSFMKRALQISDLKKRENTVFCFWQYLNETFPEWKKNRRLRKITIKNIYLKIVNRRMLKVAVVLFK